MLFPAGVLLIAASLAVLGGCSPPPLPAAQRATGAQAATVDLQAQPAHLKAKLHATSVAEVKEGGWVELRVFANDRECTADQVARQGAMGPHFSVSLHCEAEVPSGTPFRFHAEQNGRDAATREVTLEASYER